MADLKLFKRTDQDVQELTASSVRLERDLQTLIEANMETMFGVKFLETEYRTGKVHRGRIDSLGLDENGSPVIFEYKRGTNENVINQGLFYLDWLMDHQADFRILVMDKLGPEAANKIDWTAPRLMCVARDFTRYDQHAVAQIDRNIGLVSYSVFDEDTIALELIATQANADKPTAEKASPSNLPRKTIEDALDGASDTLRSLFRDLTSFCEDLGDDVTKKVLKHYVAFRRMKNFATVELHPQNDELAITVKLDLDTLTLEEGFSEDITHIGHLGTGNVRLRVNSIGKLEKAFPLIQQSYDAN